MINLLAEVLLADRTLSTKQPERFRAFRCLSPGPPGTRTNKRPTNAVQLGARDVSPRVTAERPAARRCGAGMPGRPRAHCLTNETGTWTTAAPPCGGAKLAEVARAFTQSITDTGMLPVLFAVTPVTCPVGPTLMLRAILPSISGFSARPRL